MVPSGPGVLLETCPGVNVQRSMHPVAESLIMLIDGDRVLFTCAIECGPPAGGGERSINGEISPASNDTYLNSYARRQAILVRPRVISSHDLPSVGVGTIWMHAPKQPRSSGYRCAKLVKDTRRMNSWGGCVSPNSSHPARG